MPPLEIMQQQLENQVETGMMYCTDFWGLGVLHLGILQNDRVVYRILNLQDVNRNLDAKP